MGVDGHLSCQGFSTNSHFLSLQVVVRFTKKYLNCWRARAQIWFIWHVGVDMKFQLSLKFCWAWHFRFVSRGARDANADIMSVHKQSEVFSISPRNQFMLTISFPRRHILCEGDGEREIKQASRVTGKFSLRSSCTLGYSLFSKMWKLVVLAV